LYLKYTREGNTTLVLYPTFGRILEDDGRSWGRGSIQPLPAAGSLLPSRRWTLPRLSTQRLQMVDEAMERESHRSLQLLVLPFESSDVVLIDSQRLTNRPLLQVEVFPPLFELESRLDHDKERV
jgi:hypothetical protein